MIWEGVFVSDSDLLFSFFLLRDILHFLSYFFYTKANDCQTSANDGQTTANNCLTTAYYCHATAKKSWSAQVVRSSM